LKTIKVHFKKPYLVLIAIIIILTFLFFVVKIRKFI